MFFVVKILLNYVDPPPPLLPEAFSFYFCYDLDLCSQSQTLSAFSVFCNVVKSTRRILVKPVRKLHRLVAHDLLIITLWLSYICM